MLFTLTIALAPLPLGSNRDWAWSPLALVVGLLLLGLAFSKLPGGEWTSLPLRALAVPFVLTALVTAWGVIQTLDVTPMGWANPVRQAAKPMLPLIEDHLVALSGERAMMGLMRLMTYWGVFVLAVILCSDVQRARILSVVIVVSALAYTVYAMVFRIVDHLGVAVNISLYTPVDEQFSGPFVNRNNYATYAAIATVTALSLVMRSFAVNRRDEKMTARQRWRYRLRVLGGRGGVALAAAVILFVGVLLSGSRGGWIGFASGLLTLAVIQAIRSGRWLLVLGAVVGLSVVMVVLPAGNFILRRYMITPEANSQSREYLFAMIDQAIMLRPLLGWGLNSFEPLYGVFQPLELRQPFDKAHNTYLETAFDLGIPAAIALVLAVLWIVARCVQGIKDRRRSSELPALGVVASVVVGVHALIDFSLQIPAIAVVFSAILGMSWAQSWSTERRRAGSHDLTPRKRESSDKAPIPRASRSSIRGASSAKG